jgi:hypothetical protein
MDRILSFLADYAGWLGAALVWLILLGFVLWRRAATRSIRIAHKVDVGIKVGTGSEPSARPAPKTEESQEGPQAAPLGLPPRTIRPRSLARVTRQYTGPIIDFDELQIDKDRIDTAPDQRQLPQAQQRIEPPATDGQEADRYINLAFRRGNTGQAVPWQQSLPPGDPGYELRINIGALLADRIPDGREMRPSVFPAFALPPAAAGHWLEVVTASRDFTISQRAKARLFLPHQGASWVCDCDPRQPHHCTPQTRKQFLAIPVQTPPQEGDADLRIGVYFKNNLLQSCLVSVRIARTETMAKPQSVLTDYTINGTLSALGKLDNKTLNILSAKIKGGDQGFIVNGDFDDLVEFRLAEGQLRTAGDAARQRLRDIHMKEESVLFGARTRITSKLDANNGKSKADFIQDLRDTAPLGAQLLTSLFQQPELQAKLRDDVLREPSTIQIARASTNFVFPWGMVYDIPLQPGEPDLFTPCKIVEEWQEGKGLPIEGLAKCPHEATHELNTLCPFGFWGLRHIIEQPPSVASTKALASEIRVTVPPARLVTCISNDLEREYTEPHLAAIRSGLKFGFEPCDSKPALLKRLKTVDPGVVYLYCHGGYQSLPGAAAAQPSLSVGKGEKLIPGDIVATLKDDRSAALLWDVANPLIFINGCHTVEITTDVLVNFVDTFAAFNSSGVIGTEVTVHQILANEFGAEFLKHFATETAGEALRRTRNRLLCKGNLMGLAYSAYCLSALRIADTASLTTASMGSVKAG